MCSRRAPLPASLTRFELLNDSVRDKVSSAHATSRGIGVDAGTPFVDATRCVLPANGAALECGGRVRLKGTCLAGQTLPAHSRSESTGSRDSSNSKKGTPQCETFHR